MRLLQDEDKLPPSSPPPPRANGDTALGSPWSYQCPVVCPDRYCSGPGQSTPFLLYLLPVHLSHIKAPCATGRLEAGLCPGWGGTDTKRLYDATLCTPLTQIRCFHPTSGRTGNTSLCSSHSPSWCPFPGSIAPVLFQSCAISRRPFILMQRIDTHSHAVPAGWRKYCMELGWEKPDGMAGIPASPPVDRSLIARRVDHFLGAGVER